jgi:hypothetical protein
LVKIVTPFLENRTTLSGAIQKFLADSLGIEANRLIDLGRAGKSLTLAMISFRKGLQGIIWANKTTKTCRLAKILKDAFLFDQLSLIVLLIRN